MGRSTQGVTLIALDEGTKLAGLERVVERDSDGTAMAWQRDTMRRRPNAPGEGDAPQSPQPSED